MRITTLGLEVIPGVAFDPKTAAGYKYATE